jgi:hypothetical protein
LLGIMIYFLGATFHTLATQQKEEEEGGACDKNKGFFLGKTWPFVATL